MNLISVSDDFLLLVGQRGPTDHVHFFKAQLPATDNENLPSLVPTPILKTYFDFNPFTHEIFMTDYHGYSITPVINKINWNSPTETRVVNRNFVAMAGDETPSLEGKQCWYFSFYMCITSIKLELDKCHIVHHPLTFFQKDAIFIPYH